MRFAVSVTQCIAQNDAAVFMRLHAESQLPGEPITLATA